MKNFREQIKSAESPVVAVFSAEWCGPCKMFAPIFEQVKSTYKDAEFIKLNVDDCEDICLDLDVRSVPTIIRFKAGREVARKIGAFANATAFETWIVQGG